MTLLIVAGLVLVAAVVVFFVVGTVRRSRKPETTPPEPAADSAAPERAAAIAEPPGDGLGRGLRRTTRALSERLASILARGGLDDESWDELEEALIRADVGVKAAGRIVSRVKDRRPSLEELRGSLHDEVVAALGTEARELRVQGSPCVWLVTGVNGVGKTTTIAKLAYRLVSEGRTVALAAADTFRAAAGEQLETWAARVGVHVVGSAPGADPGAVLFDAIAHAKARGVDVIIADTAGRIHTKTNLMEELAKLRRVAEREAGEIAEVLLVLDATVGQNGIAQARTFQEAVEVTGVILTKLDGTAKGGIVVAIEDELKIPVKAVGVGESLSDLQPFHPDEFVKALLADSA